MSRILIILLILSVTGANAQTDIKLVDTKVSKSINMSIPELMSWVPETEIPSRHLSYRPPVALFTSPDGKTDLAVNVSLTQWDESDLDMMKDFYSSSIESLYTDVEFLEEKKQTINGREYVVLKFISKVEGTASPIDRTSINKYTHIQYTIANGKTYLFNFTCPASQQAQWEKTAEEMMQTVKIKKTL